MTPRRGAPGCDTADRVSLTRRATLEKRNHNGCGGWCGSDQPRKIALFYRLIKKRYKKAGVSGRTRPKLHAACANRSSSTSAQSVSAWRGTCTATSRGPRLLAWILMRLEIG